MTLTEFNKLVSLTRMGERKGKTYRACKLILVDGLSQYAAAKKCRVSASHVLKAKLRLLELQRIIAQ